MKRNIIKILFLAGCICLLAACGNEISNDRFSSKDIADESSTEKNIDNENEIVSVQYVVGDIILADGSVVKAEEFTDLNSSNLPVAVIAGFKEDGTAFAIGVHRSGEPLQWALDDTIGYSTRFEELVCRQEKDMTFHGDVDGSDNWNAVCVIDSEGTAEAKENYPAFHFVNTYAETYGLTGTYAFGWYMPGITELCAVYENREVIDTALEKIYDLNQNAAMNGLTTNWYWSSSQADSEDDYAWFVHYFNGYAGECPKNFTNLHVIVIRDF